MTRARRGWELLHLVTLATCAACASCAASVSLASRPGAVRAVFDIQGSNLLAIQLGDFELTDITLLGEQQLGGRAKKTIKHVGFKLRDTTKAAWIGTCEVRDNPADHGDDLASTTLVDHSYTEIECVYHPEDSAEGAAWHAHLFAQEGNFWQVNSVSGDLLPADFNDASGSGFRVSGTTRQWDLRWRGHGSPGRGEGASIVGAVEIRPDVMTYLDPSVPPRRRRAASLLFATALAIDRAAMTPSEFMESPPPQPGLKATQVSVAYAQLCVLREDGSVRCLDRHGVLDPQVAGATHITTSGSSGGGHGCAALIDGRVACWAMGSRGAVLGMGNFMTPQARAEHVFGVANVAKVTSDNDDGTCALRRDGTVLCWGKDGKTPAVVAGAVNVAQIRLIQNRCDGLSGRLEDGTLRRLLYAADPVCERTDGGIMQSFLVHATGLRGVKDFAAGTDYACALGEDGAVMCWGFGKDNVLRYTAELGGSREPSPVPDLHDVTQLAAGDRHACALVRGGAVMCWGYNSAGELGDGSNRDRARPGQVQGLADAVQIAAAGSLTCAVRAAGGVVCWGDGAGLRGPARLPRAIDLP